MEAQKNAIIYCRVSSKEQADGFSLESQRATCSRFAEQLGHRVIKVFSNDEGESAKTVDRPALKDLIVFVSKKKQPINFLIVWKFDRLARNLNDYTSLLTYFTRLGVDVLSATEPADESSAGKLMKNIIGSFAQYENDVRSERTTAGMKQAVKEGYWVWRAPKGYSYQKDALGKQVLQPNEQAQFIQKAFSLAEQGTFTQVEIRKLLQREGFHISGQTLNHILRNPVYAGLIRKKEWFADPVKGIHKPLITEDQFALAQRALSRKKVGPRTRSQNNPDFPLRNFVVCSACGVRLTGSHSTGRGKVRHAYYHCRHSKCGSGSVRQGSLHEQFTEVLRSVQPQRETINLFGEIVRDIWRSRSEQRASEKQRIERETQRLDEHKAKALNLFIKDAIAEADYQKVSEDTEAKIRALKADMLALGAKEQDLRNCLEYCCGNISDLAGSWLAGDLALRQRFQSLVFPSGITYDGGFSGTAETALIFKVLGNKQSKKTNMATLIIENWNQIIEEVRAFSNLKPAMVAC